jgi:nicotinamide-nucleotide amidase
MWFDTPERGIVISLPGVPFEMEHLMDDIVIPSLKELFTLRGIVHKTLITRGIPESILAERIAEWEDALPHYMHLAYLPAPNIVRLRLSAYDVDKAEVESSIEREFAKLNDIIGDNIVGWEGATVESLVHNILTRNNLTLAIAESCTGGTIASRFTAMAGASAYLLAGVVAYANSAKANIIGVNAEDIARKGAVSEIVARQMAEGVRRTTGADYAIATTGIAGPSGGSAEKPVGTVWMAVATPRGTIAKLRNCGTDRSQIISRASAYAIEMLYDEIRNM